MKTRFSTLDIGFELSELQHLVGMRVNKIYDADHKTYILKLQRPQEKAVLLLESGIRLHTTRFEWPKNEHPSGFTMKLRKHLGNKRVESIKQLGVDRVVDLTFGSADAAYHLILELYDKGNLVLTDHQYLILNILRPRVTGEEKFITRETYPIESVKQAPTIMTLDKINEEILPAAFAKDTNIENRVKKKGGGGLNLKKLFLPSFDKGPALMEHLMAKNEIEPGTKVKVPDDVTDDMKLLIVKIFAEANDFIYEESAGKGYISQTTQHRPTLTGVPSSDKIVEGEDNSLFHRYVEFHPMKFEQLKNDNLKEFECFDAAVDNFFSQLESQKIDAKAMQKEVASIKKLDNVKKDHEQRLGQLKEDQSLDRRKGELIELNDQLVEKALIVIRSALANQLDWAEIKELLEEAAENGDPVVSRIKNLKLDINQMTMLLANPYSFLDEECNESLSDSSENNNSENEGKNKVRFKEENQDGPLLVDLDIDLTAQANARKYYDKKRTAATKENKTIQSHSGAIKSAERRAKKDMRDANAISRIIKARKVFWFEKFLWFISSENYLIIAGRDQAQNEMIVKRYLKNNDVYVHAEVQGASSVIIKNLDGAGEVPIPPKTLNEAGQMAVCYSIAWDQKVVVNAYWVHGNQVSKTAPSGEYLSTGSFMIRGKKNFLPHSQLTLGFGFMFKLGDEESITRHKGDRKVKFDQDEQDKEHGLSDKESEPEADNDDQDSLQDQMDDLGVSDKEGKTEEDVESVDDSSENEKNAEFNVNKESTHDDSDANSNKEEAKHIIPEFPDAELKINFSSGKEGKVVELKTVSTSQTIEEAKFVHGALREVDKTKSKKEHSRGQPQWKLDQQNSCKEDNRQKRGKKGKLKKIKEKYKDQDEEDKALMMTLLQESQKNKEDSKKYKKKQDKIAAEEKKKRNQEFAQEKLQKNHEKAAAREALKNAKEQAGEDFVDDDDDSEDEKENIASNDYLDSITGIPAAEDSLVFALPVVAPYNTMVNYKYKVKITPGSAKRGKAAKTALGIFLSDKFGATQRDKDLLKSVKDQDTARNLPGKIKVSTVIKYKK